MLISANSILENGSGILSEIFRKAFPGTKYTAEVAKRRFLQMPLVTILVGDPSSGRSLTYLIESQHGTNYQTIQNLLSSRIKEKNISGLTKEVLKGILSMARSDRERELLRYTAFISGNYTQTSARRTLGLESMNRRVLKVENSIEEAKAIRESIEQMALDEVRSIIPLHDSDPDSDTELTITPEITSDVEQHLLDVLKISNFNWFEFVCQIKAAQFETSPVKVFYSNLRNFGLSEREVNLTEQSHSAFEKDEQLYAHSRMKMERLINGDIVTDSESDDPELYNKDQEKALRKRVEAIKTSAKRQAAKRIANKKYLQRTYSHPAQNIITKFPDIGNTIEKFVQECNVGADAWRRTGILTFDGNIKV